MKKIIGILIVFFFSVVTYQYLFSPHKKESAMSRQLSHTLITFIAPPGGGKGTVSLQAAQELGFKIISTGNLCRIYKEKDNAIGREMRECLDKGLLVPDSIISAMVRDWLKENADGTPIILDGYPRTVGQAQDLDEMLLDCASDYTFKVVELNLSADTIVNRLSSRMICSEKSCQRPHTVSNLSKEQTCDSCKAKLIRRQDDVPEVIKERFAVYQQGSLLIKEHFKSRGRDLDAILADNKTPEEVFEEFKKLVIV